MGAPSLPGFKLDQTFFGLKPSDRIKLHDNIFELIWHGEGRWDWNTIYNMPIFLRIYLVKKVNSKLNPIASTNKPDIKSKNKIHRPPKPIPKYKR